MIDPVTEQCRRNREQLVERLGGLAGLFDRLEELQRERDRAAATRRAARRKSTSKGQAIRSGRKPSTRSKSPTHPTSKNETGAND